MAAEVLANSGVQVDLYEAKPSVGRKFLVAGKGGLNLTHAEPFEQFLSRFGEQSKQLQEILRSFTPMDFRDWCNGLGIETFAGPSGRVFPLDMKAAPLLQRWTQRLREQGVRIQTRHRWQGWVIDGTLLFETPNGPLRVVADAVVLTLGGASWPKLGSDGTWVEPLIRYGLDVAPLQPANCGFEVPWSAHFRERFAGEPLKSVMLKFMNSNGQMFERQGSCVITEYGLEGSLIYAASALIREEINIKATASITLDLMPDLAIEKLIQRLSEPRGSKSLSSYLKSKLKLQPVAISLLREFENDSHANPVRLAQALKALPIPLTAARPIEEAISTAGGVRWECLNPSLMVKLRPGLFCAGEMLNWEAPTGGYLLTACFATGKAAGQGALEWIRRSGEP